MAGPRLSQSQRDVLALYRRGIRMVRTKPESTQSHFLLYLRHAFKHPSQGGGISRRDVAAIDYMLRRGQRMIEGLEKPGVKDVTLPREVLEELERKRRAEAS